MPIGGLSPGANAMSDVHGVGEGRGVGVPVGSDLDYADEFTMHKAMSGRTEI